MFSLFGDPFYYRPAYRYGFGFNPLAYARASDIFDRYLDAFESRLFGGLDYDQQPAIGGQSAAQTPPPGPAAKPTQEAKPVEPSGEAPPPPPPPQEKEQAKSESAAPKRSVPQSYGRRYVFQKRATWDGQNYVEEHRERVKSQDGETRSVVRRRLGDRWYENETHTDKDGKTTERETWHNVADDQIENFKLEWSEKHRDEGEAPKQALESTPKPTGD